MTEPVRDPEVRITRMCDGCKQIDSDPHHMDTDATGTTTSMHHDCHRDIVGCDICRQILEQVGDLKGEELTNAIIETNPTVEA